MKELEAFDEIIKCCNEYHHMFTEVDIETIKGYPIENIRKSLKALEILKPCCIVADYKCENSEDRYELAFCRKICITEEEYNLLKEVL